MSRTFRAEWIKQRHARFLLGWGGLLAGVPALITLAIFLTAGQLDRTASGRPADPALPTVAHLSQAGGMTTGLTESATFLGILALALVAVRVTMEFSHGTWRALLVTEPQRLQVLGGKLLALSSYLAAATLLATIISAVTAWLLAPQIGIDTGAWATAGALRHVAADAANVTVATIVHGLLGAALGVLTRSAVGAIGIGVGWLLVVEQLLSGLFEPAARWLPGINLLLVAHGGPPSHTTYDAAAMVFVIVLGAAALAAAAVLLQRRDVLA